MIRGLSRVDTNSSGWWIWLKRLRALHRITMPLIGSVSEAQLWRYMACVDQTLLAGALLVPDVDVVFTDEVKMYAFQTICVKFY
jgi:hypothetical protein